MSLCRSDTLASSGDALLFIFLIGSLLILSYMYVAFLYLTPYSFTSKWVLVVVAGPYSYYWGAKIDMHLALKVAGFCSFIN